MLMTQLNCDGMACLKRLIWRPTAAEAQGPVVGIPLTVITKGEWICDKFGRHFCSVRCKEVSEKGLCPPKAGVEVAPIIIRAGKRVQTKKHFKMEMIPAPKKTKKSVQIL